MLAESFEVVWECVYVSAVIAQLGERQTEDLKVPGSIPGHGSIFTFSYSTILAYRNLTVVSQ